MRLNEGVEWAAHACALLGGLPPSRSISGAALAEFLDVPRAYMAKQMQALSRAGLVETARGPAGGYRLAKLPSAISMNDIAVAIEGREPAFKCQEVRRRGPAGATPEACKRPCGIAAAFYAAERAWRAELAKMSVADAMADGQRALNDKKRGAAAAKWFADNIR